MFITGNTDTCILLAVWRMGWGRNGEHRERRLKTEAKQMMMAHTNIHTEAIIPVEKDGGKLT